MVPHPMEADVRENSDRALPASSSDEAGRKRLTQEITASTSVDSVTGSPTSRPPLTNNDPMSQNLRWRMW